MAKLETITAEDLQNRTYEPTHFLVDELIPEGLHILAGAPKIGKSWLALWLCLCVAQGQALWNFATTQGEALYLSLEDSFQRIQTRLFDLTEDAPPTLHFAIMADTLKHGLDQQIEQFLTEHPDTKLVVIDTLQRVRGTGSDSNLYANDYQDIGILKQLADRRHIAILLIHHLRKLHDDDPMNMISGSTGLSGAADSTFVLQKNSRLANIASLHCTGRDIPDRTLKLEFGEDDHVRKLLEDSKTCSGASKISTLQLVHLFSALLSADPTYSGTPSALSAKIDPDGKLGITPKKVTRLVLESVETLRENGVLVKTYRSNGKRLISPRNAESADLPTVEKIDPKTVDENYYLLTLAAIAKEIAYRNAPTATSVILAAGLPLTSFGREKKAFRAYLLREGKPVSFSYEGISYETSVQDVKLFPQGYAAILQHSDLLNEPSVILADIGGWTVDIMRLDNRIPHAASCRSLELGMIRCLDEIAEQVRRSLNLSLTSVQIENVLRGSPDSMDDRVKAIIQREAGSYARRILSAIAEAGLDCRAMPVVFLGGGAGLMKRYLPQGSVLRPVILDDDKLNAQAYERLAGQVADHAG